MGRIDSVIPDDLERRLRIRALELYGGKKGSLTEALIAAIEAWVDETPSVKERKEKKS